MSPEERFWARVVRDGCSSLVRPDLGPCWLYNGRADRYGTFRISKREPVLGAHRYSYQTRVGPIPDGFDLDHLCMVKGCVRPDHLEPVWPNVNIRRALRYYRLRNARRAAA